ncbi:MAG: heparinase, partial [Gemmatimonadetes bacterium]|nr:heparinase [Gemmatimonadota bacterium]
MEILDRAEQLHQGRFDLLGYRDLFFGDPIDWQLDPILGRRSPRAHWSRINHLDVEQVGDHKVVWELNRHQYFQTLCRAFVLTGDPTHADLVVRHLEEWMAANPPKTGINWVSSLELAYRSISWIWALSIMAHSSRL